MSPKVSALDTEKDSQMVQVIAKIQLRVRLSCGGRSGLYLNHDGMGAIQNSRARDAESITAVGRDSTVSDGAPGS